jgi:hypothetical protein
VLTRCKTKSPLDSIRTTDVFVFPAFSSNDLNVIGEEWKTPTVACHAAIGRGRRRLPASGTESRSSVSPCIQ